MRFRQDSSRHGLFMSDGGNQEAKQVRGSEGQASGGSEAKRGGNFVNEQSVNCVVLSRRFVRRQRQRKRRNQAQDKTRPAHSLC